MGNEADNKYTWVIKKISSTEFKRVYSDKFVIGGCKWRLRANVSFFSFTNLSLYLEVADPNLLPSGWKRHVRYRLSILNKIPGKEFQCKEQQQWFSCRSHVGKSKEMLPLSKLKAKDSGFLVNGELKIVVEVLEVVESEEALKKGKLDVVALESEEALKKRKLDVLAASSDLLNQATQQPNESVDVNGFLVLPSQVDIVRRVFEKHPDIALEYHPKTPHMRKARMNSILSLIETMCQSPQELSDVDLVEAENVLTDVKDSGFKVDWLKKKLEELKEKKKDEQTGVTQIEKLEKDLKEYKKTRSDMYDMLKKKKDMLKKENTKVLVAKTLLAKEKSKLFAARVPLTMEDVI